MDSREVMHLSRRRWLQTTAAAAGGGLLVDMLGRSLGPGGSLLAQAATATDPVTAQRTQMAASPIETTRLGANLTMLSGPGGNIVVLNGPDGKVMVDTFVLPVWAKLKQTIDGLGGAPVKLLINTHWHFDHTDNNGNFKQAGATIVAHENTSKRMSETHDLLGMHFTPAPVPARPTQTFKTTHTLTANGESLLLSHIPPAHTDTDISVRYTKANVLHMGDVFFNGIYPFIDGGTGGSINGMIGGADVGLKAADASTRIVPGHGPLADRAALQRYRDMLVAVRDRVQKLKTSGRSLKDAQAAKPTASFDAVWGKGFMMPDDFVALVYNTL